MKIRTCFVSNSSSSSFLLCGKDIISTLMKFVNDNYVISYDDYYYANVGRINQEIINQCKHYSNNERITEVIRALLVGAMSSYYDYYTWGKTDNCFSVCSDDYNFYNNHFKGTVFELSNDLIEQIKKESEKYKDENGIFSSWVFLYDEVNHPKIYEQINKQADEIFKKLKELYGDVYVVSFGDNHGECDGDIGAIVEYQYLGENQINSYIKDKKIKIFQLNEH